MKNTIINKLFWLLKLCIFNILVTAPLLAQAEYYQVYASPEPSDQCFYCQGQAHHHAFKTHPAAAKKPHRSHAHYRYHRKNGLYVYYPRQRGCPCGEVWTLEYCQCCPHPNRVRSQWGDYVVFSARPVDRNRGITPEEGPSYNPDMSTTDDGRPDMEIN